LSSNNLAFTNTSTGSGVLTSSSWTFGDGGTSTSTNPSHTYAQVGWYNVCLTVIYSSATGSHTCTTCDSVYVQSVGGGTSGNCFANAAFNQTISGNTVSFSNSSTCNLCTSVSYIWNFGDASALSTVVNPTHTYNAGGSYNVCLIINGVDSNQQVCSDTLCKPINVGSSALDEVEVSHLNIYPNPASGMIEINIPTSNQFQVHILDVSGRIQSTKKFNNHQGPVQMPVDHFASGLYFIRAESDGQKWHGSFIKK
jgi:PKD repeat protein